MHNLANSLLTTHILDISEIEANRMVMESIPFTMRGEVFNGLKTLAMKANEKFLSLAYQVDSSVPDYVIIDLGNCVLPALKGRSISITAGHSRSFDVLLAEDNNVSQKVVVKILEKYNHGVTVVSNGLEAVEAIKKCRYDVILMDIGMPVMGGFEATGKIREYENENGLPRTPIIAIGAPAMLGDREKYIQAQMDEYLAKPLKQNQMIQTILKCATLGGSFSDKSRTSRGGAGSSEPHQCLSSNAETIQSKLQNIFVRKS